jgi:hypothetical protein
MIVSGRQDARRPVDVLQNSLLDAEDMLFPASRSLGFTQEDEEFE